MNRELADTDNETYLRFSAHRMGGYMLMNCSRKARSEWT